MNYGFFKVCCASPKLVVADCSYNAEKIIDCVREASEEKAGLIVFPELSITGYTCQDLFLQKSLQNAAVENLEYIAKKTSGLKCLICVGLPLASGNSLYNCACVIYKGKIIAVVPKTFIPNYSEFYEKRWFASALKNTDKEIYISEKNPRVPFGTDIIICDEKNSGFKLGI